MIILKLLYVSKNILWLVNSCL